MTKTKSYLQPRVPDEVVFFRKHGFLCSPSLVKIAQSIRRGESAPYL